MIKSKKKAIPNFFFLLVLAAGIAWVCGRFVHLGNVEYTDNAQVKQHLTPVNTRIQGFIKKSISRNSSRSRKEIHWPS